MPMLLQHIDAIARAKQRDVLYLTFPPAEPLAEPRRSYESLDSRERIIAWLDANAVGWTMCGHVASENTMRSYAGQIYIDVPYDSEDPTYQRVQAFLEFADGSMRFEDAKFWVVSLEEAMKNAHHDEPGFWERWADNF
ncbi:hypothetical protein CBA19CS11_32330 [Caballeronia novacaledonica]|uniref:hypothetical protein n=1 Tax=Caballeronia novacaledonica TaxID=1544861 RepID=UPI001EE33055|nr:hypothetical protein [Caballeronia novacaledonica]GJH13626.1 hypothetical protein CBA19CS11_32330 [Caballeronia novacaledonica]